MLVPLTLLVGLTLKESLDVAVFKKHMNRLVHYFCVYVLVSYAYIRTNDTNISKFGSVCVL